MDLLSLQKSPEDLRDYHFINFQSSNQTYPETLDLRKYLPPIRNQGTQGTCAAQVAACMKEYQEKINHNFNGYMSPQFVYNFRDYWNNNIQDGEDKNEDYGMNCRNIMKILLKNGICPENYYRYGTIEYSDAISESVIQLGLKYRIRAYARIFTIKELKISLYKNGPCLIAFPVYHSGMNMWKSMPNHLTIRGGHAMAAVGYNKDGFIIRNSWGESWGQGGYCIYPYEDWGKHWEVWTTVDDITVEHQKKSLCPRHIM